MRYFAPTPTSEAPQTDCLPQDQAVLELLPKVRYIAQRISARIPPHVDAGDLVNAGVLGLLEAVGRYDTTRGVKFRTFAESRIRGAILDSLRSLDWAPRRLRQKSRNLEKATRKLRGELGREPSQEEICAETGLEMDDLHRLAGRIKGLTLTSLTDLSNDEDRGAPTREVADKPEHGPATLFEKSELRAMLARAIDQLPPRERLVVSLYYYDELSMKEIASVLGVNESRVSQFHTQAMGRMRLKLRKLEGPSLSPRRPQTAA